MKNTAPTAAILFALVSASSNGVLLSTLSAQYGSARVDSIVRDGDSKLTTTFRANTETGEIDTFVVVTR